MLKWWGIYIQNLGRQRGVAALNLYMEVNDFWE